MINGTKMIITFLLFMVEIKFFASNNAEFYFKHLLLNDILLYEQQLFFNSQKCTKYAY